MRTSDSGSKGDERGEGARHGAVGEERGEIERAEAILDADKGRAKHLAWMARFGHETRRSLDMQRSGQYTTQ
jgi:hypothetical protein